MLFYLIVIFLALPFIDIFLLIQAVDFMGFLPTLMLILITGIVGATILKREAKNVGRKLSTSVTAKEVSRNLLEGTLVVLGGLMLLTPGFVTDLIGLSLLLRPSRIKITLFIENKLRKNSNFQVHVEQF